MQDLLLLAIGWALGFLSSIVTVLLQQRFEMRKRREEWAREDKLREQRWNREDALREDERLHEARQQMRAGVEKNWQTYRKILGTRATVVMIALAAASVVYAWTATARSGEARIADLSQEEKEKYIVLVGQAYATDQNLDRAEERLRELEVPNVSYLVAELADTYIREGRDQKEIVYLVALASGLGTASPAMLAYLPTNTPVPGIDTPKPTARPTAKPTAKPTKPAAKWSWTARLVGPGEDAQTCEGGLSRIRVTVVNAAGQQIGGVWIYDKYSGQYQVTGNVDSPDWGPGETKFEYGAGGGGSLCIASSQDGPCETGFTRDMTCDTNPAFEDKWAAGYCLCCSSEAAANKDLCRQLYDSGDACIAGPRGYYSWRVVFTRSW